MYSTSLKNKIWLGFCAGWVTGETFGRLTGKYFSQWIPHPLIIGLAILILLTCLILAFVWHAREKRNAINGTELKTRLEHLLLYAFALDYIMFGFHKIEGLQMRVPLGLLDTPFSSLRGETLLWAFFRYSYPFTVVIASLQILSGSLLLFSRTRLFGLMIGIVTLTVIMSLNIFYHMPPGVLVHSIALLFGAFYFVSQDWKRITEFIFQPLQGSKSLNISNFHKNMYRISFLVWPILFHFILDYPDKHPKLTGKYQVENLKVNDVAFKAKSPKDSILTTVYMDEEDEFVFDFNDYRYRYIGKYFLNVKNDSITIKWRYPSDKLDEFKGKLIRTKDKLLLNGKMNGEKLEMKLSK